MKHFLIPAVLAFGVSLPIPAHSMTFTTPLDPGMRDRVASELLKDEEFKMTFLKRMLLEEEGKAATMARDGMKPQASAGNMMPEPKERETPGKSPSASSGMREGGTAGMVGQESEKSAAETAKPEDPFTVPEQPKAGTVAENGEFLPKSKLLEAAGVKIVPVKGGAGNVDLFLSLSCPHCEKLWRNLRANEPTRNHLLEDRVDIWILPASNADGAITLVYNWVMAQNPELAMEFLDSYFDRAFGEGVNDESFIKIDAWMRENGLRALDDLRLNKRGLDAVGARVQKGIDRAGKLGVTGYPSVYADGKEDRSYFSRIISANSAR